MALSHAGFSIPGIHETPNFGDWDRQEEFTSVFGLKGALHQFGGLTMRTINYRILIFNSYNSSALLLNYLSSLENRIGTVGTLTQTGVIARTLNNILYEGFVPDGSPLYSAQLGWHQDGLLYFRQLSP